jgi:hypothetical protein
MMYLQNSPMRFASLQMLSDNFYKEKSRLLDDNKRLFTMRWWWSADAGSIPISKALGQVYGTCPRFWRLSVSRRENTCPALTQL